jgi:hypothetical protein
MSHDILQGGRCIASYGLTGSLDQRMVSILRSGDGLGLRVDRWFRQARKNGFDKSIQQCVERLLAPHNAEVVTGHALKSPSDSILALGQFRSPVEFALDCRPDERARAREASRFDGLVDPFPIFPTQSHGDSGSARRSRILSHNCSLNY